MAPGNTGPTSSVLWGGLGRRTAPTWLPHSLKAKRNDSIPHFSFESLSLRAVLSRKHPALGLEPAAGKGPVGSEAPRNVGRPGAAPLPAQLFQLSYSQSPCMSPGDPEGGPVAHWLALPWPFPSLSLLPLHSPAPSQGAGLPALESPPQSPGLCSSATDKPCPLPMVGARPPRGPLATSLCSTLGAWAACQLVLGHRCTPAGLEVGLTVGGQNVPEPH